MDFSKGIKMNQTMQRSGTDSEKVLHMSHSTSEQSTTSNEPQETRLAPEELEKTWSEDEDLILCSTWLRHDGPIPQDFWQQSLPEYDYLIKNRNRVGAVGGPHPPRTPSERESRWNHIQVTVYKFYKFFKLVKPFFAPAKILTPKYQDEILLETYLFYDEVHESPFPYFFCYENLIDSPDWPEVVKKLDLLESRASQIISSTSQPEEPAVPIGRTSPAGTVATTKECPASVEVGTSKKITTTIQSKDPIKRPHDVDEDYAIFELAGLTSSSSSRSDPQQEKQVKKLKANHNDDEGEAPTELLPQELVEISLRQVDILQTIADNRVMSVDTSTLDPASAAYYRWKKKDILDRLNLSID